jgi:hypothetical protein
MERERIASTSFALHLRDPLLAAQNAPARTSISPTPTDHPALAPSRFLAPAMIRLPS